MAVSYNGWSAEPGWSVKGGQIVPLVVGGESFAPGVRAGAAAVVLRYVAEQMNARVEPVVRSDWHQADDWGYSYRTNRNAANLSCHASGTAIDYNASRHPNGKRGTFTPAQVKAIRAILAELGGIVRWGGDFTGTPDEMHFEIVGSPATTDMVASRLRRISGPTVPPIKTPPIPLEEDPLSALSDAEQRELLAGIRSTVGWLRGYDPAIDALQKIGQETADVAKRVRGYDPNVDSLQALYAGIANLTSLVAQRGAAPGITAADIAELIPANLARQVADELHNRLAA